VRADGRSESEVASDIVDTVVILHDMIMNEYLTETGYQYALTANENKGYSSLDSSLASSAVTSRDGVYCERSPKTALLASKLNLPPLWRAEGTPPSPWAAMTMISRNIARDLPSLGEQERIAIDSQFTEITKQLSTCERILRTPIPLGYTRYTVRFLWLWLSLLPFALVRTFGEFGAGTWWADKPKPVVLLAMGFIGLIFLSIEDIGVQIEEPFAILPLRNHQTWLTRDAESCKAMLNWYMDETFNSNSNNNPNEHAEEHAGEGEGEGEGDGEQRDESTDDDLWMILNG